MMAVEARKEKKTKEEIHVYYNWIDQVDRYAFRIWTLLDIREYYKYKKFLLGIIWIGEICFHVIFNKSPIL